MQFQFDVSANRFPTLEPSPTPDVHDLLRQILEVEREQLAQLRVFLGAQDGGMRWRAFMERWRQQFADLPQACRQALPILEQSYGKMIAELTDQLCQNGSEALDNDFALQEFLDRYGMRLTQLGTILNLVAPFAEAGPKSESA